MYWLNHIFIYSAYTVLLQDCTIFLLDSATQLLSCTTPYCVVIGWTSLYSNFIGHPLICGTYRKAIYTLVFQMRHFEIIMLSIIMFLIPLSVNLLQVKNWGKIYDRKYYRIFLGDCTIKTETIQFRMSMYLANFNCDLEIVNRTPIAVSNGCV